MGTNFTRASGIFQGIPTSIIMAHIHSLLSQYLSTMISSTADSCLASSMASFWQGIRVQSSDEQKFTNIKPTLCWTLQIICFVLTSDLTVVLSLKLVDCKELYPTYLSIRHSYI